MLFDRRQALGALLFAGIAPAPSAAAKSVEHVGAAPLALAKGFNLPDHAPLRSSKKADVRILARLRDLGMTHVRLPISAEFYLPSFSGRATLASASDDLERTLERLLALGYCVTVDMHPQSDFSTLLRADAEAGYAALLDGWRGLAKRLSQWPSNRVYVELLNEPATTDAIWRELAERLTRELRPILPNTTFIVGPAPFQRFEALARWRPLPDPNIVYAFHYYSPMIFTHQGAEWDVGSAYARLARVPFPIKSNDVRLLDLADAYAAKGDAPISEQLREAAKTEFTAATIMAQFAQIGAWSREHSAPVIVNEFGALRFKAKREDRLDWLAAVSAAARSNGFGWAHWDFSDGFGMVGADGQLDMAVIRALLGS